MTSRRTLARVPSAMRNLQLGGLRGWLLVPLFCLTAGGAPARGCPREMVPTGVGTCIDREEWHDPQTRRPLIGVSAVPEREHPQVPSLVEHCRSVGKRTCDRQEWVSACSGGEHRYPYGDEWEPGACNDNRVWKTVDEVKVARRDPREMARLDESEPVGSKSECRSPSGAFDMVGNAEEWVRCSEGRFGWCLAGGYWASWGSKTCSSAVRVHAPNWHFAATGGRCCRGLE